MSMKDQSHEVKLEFIKSVLAQTGIPAHFAPCWKTNSTEKIFYRIKDGQKQKREWVFFQEDKFYCVYCLCFALKENVFVKGVEYVKGCRITDKLNIHEEATYHNHALGTYLKHCPTQEACHYNSEKRDVMRIIVKIIIYLATHGKHSKNHYLFQIISRSIKSIYN